MWNKPKDRTQRVDDKNGVICLAIMFTSKVFFPDDSKKLVTVWAISLCTCGRSHRVLAENGMFNGPWT